MRIFLLVSLLFVGASRCLASDVEHPLLPYTDAEELIFVLSERASPPTGIEPPNDTQLAVHHLVVDEYFAIIQGFNTHFDRYEQLPPADLPADWNTISTEFRQLAENYSDELSQAYHALIVSGEMASRFGVNSLPAVLQLQGRHRFKITYDAADFDIALKRLTEMEYEILSH